MLAVISPAKTLDFETPPLTDIHTTPDFLDLSQQLIAKLRRLSGREIGSLMSISPALVKLNQQRYRDWDPPFTPANAKPALMAFKGDVYTGFDLESFKKADFQRAQEKLRILSGLYGVLRPLDLIQPYRLEMGTKLSTRRGKDLYKFWKPIVSETLNEAIEESGGDTLINLASNEYFDAVDKKKLNARIVTPVFKDEKNGAYKVISFFAKKARGAMSDFFIRNRISKPEDLKQFNGLGYQFQPAQSKEDTLVFTRAEKAQHGGA